MIKEDQITWGLARSETMILHCHDLKFVCFARQTVKIQ